MPFPAVIAAVAAAVFIATAAMTGLVRRYSIRRGVLDVPGERSSHTRPTPRGGGLAIAVSVSAATILLWAMRWIPGHVALAYGGGGILVSAVGWLDDHRPVAARWRALVHAAAAIWAVYWLGGLERLTVGAWTLPLGVLGSALAVVAIVWLTNLYNFMDGTDGFAGIQGLCAGIMGAVVLARQDQPGLALLCSVLAASSAGFLPWNWQPARIFMGDVGSYLLGFSFAVLAVESERSGAFPALGWTILLGIFVWDATFTLLRRVAAGERWYDAHRGHAYQRLVQLGLSHRGLALGGLALNVLILWPLAYVTELRNDLALWTSAAAALVVGAIWLLVNRRYARGSLVREPR